MPKLETQKAAAYDTDGEKVESRRIGARTFNLRNGVWYQTGYKDEAAATLKRDSQPAKDLLKQHTDIKEVLALKELIVLKIADRWYKFEAALQ